MAWFKVDDNLLSHPKVLMMPRSVRMHCLGLWILVGSWSSSHLTDGHVPGFVLEDLGGIPELRDELIRVGLWVSDGAEGIVFHDWCDYQPTREEVLAKRENVSKARSDAGRMGGVKSGEARAKQTRSKTEAKAKQNEAPTRPDPTRPSTSNEVDKGRATRIPTPFSITATMVDWFTSKNLTVDIELETEKFENYYQALNGSKALKKDWAATWRNWMLQAQSYLPANAKTDPWAGKEHLGFAE